MTPSPDPTFAMICCAHGAEGVVKAEIARDGWRLAFSRPGFVTCKHDERRDLPQGIFIRTSATSIGSARGDEADVMIESLREKLQTLSSERGHVSIDHLHVWPRDRAPIGRFDFEPGVDELSRAVGERIVQKLGDSVVPHGRLNQTADSGQSVLDVVLVDPGHWFFGIHTASRWATRWPGGIQPISPAEEPISRAYYKAAEAITWSGFDMRAGDLAVEVGSAPGGACGRLLELGLDVIGIDPAEMDPRIAEHPHFVHYTARAGDLPRRLFRGAKWLLVDSNVKPDATLSTVENLVLSRETEFVGLIITLKLGDYDRVDQIPRWRDRVASWNPKRIEIRQLARNRTEVCFAITMR